MPKEILTSKENNLLNFGMPNPEGYHKARRAMKLAEKFGKPVLSFIDADLMGRTSAELVRQREDTFRNMGRFTETPIKA